MGIFPWVSQFFFFSNSLIKQKFLLTQSVGWLVLTKISQLADKDKHTINSLNGVSFLLEIAQNGRFTLRSIKFLGESVFDIALLKRSEMLLLSPSLCYILYIKKL